MEDKLLNLFVKKIESLGVPYYSIGRIEDKNRKTKFFEVLVRRPERYDKKDLIKKIPLTYRGYKVKIL